MSKIIKLTKGLETIVDDEDYEVLSKYSWYVIKKSNTYYAVRNAFKDGKRKTIHMHRFIKNLVTLDGEYLNPGAILDHIDRNRLNNQKNNLRLASKSNNSMNRLKMNGKFHSKYKGVSLSRGKFHAYINFNKKRVNIGYFDTELEAAIAYNNAAIQYHKNFACLNEVGNE